MHPTPSFEWPQDAEDSAGCGGFQRKLERTVCPPEASHDIGEMVKILGIAFQTRFNVFIFTFEIERGGA